MKKFFQLKGIFAFQMPGIKLKIPKNQHDSAKLIYTDK